MGLHAIIHAQTFLPPLPLELDDESAVAPISRRRPCAAAGRFLAEPSRWSDRERGPPYEAPSHPFSREQSPASVTAAIHPETCRYGSSGSGWIGSSVATSPTL